MPRRGQGQKVQTATGQQYGQAKAQEEAQAVVPLPQMQQPSRRLMAPGEARFARRSERPNESIMTPGSPAPIAPRKDPVQEFRVANAAVLYEAIASAPYASPFARNAARRLRSQSPDISQFADKGMMPDVGDR